MAAQQQHHVTSAYLASGSVAVGQCVVLNEAGTGFLLASAANRTSEGRRTSGIAISAGDATNTSFEMQVVGVVPPSISGLGEGTASSIRVSDAGVLERASFDSADDVCGRCDEDGTAYVCFPLIGLAAAFGSFTLPTPNYGIIYRGTDGLPKTATHASIDSTGGYIEHDADATGGAAQSGASRFAKNNAIRVRSGDGDHDVDLIRHQYGSTKDYVVVGGTIGGDGSTDADEVYIVPKSAITLYLKDTLEGGARQGAQLGRDVNGKGIWTVLKRTNLVVVGNLDSDLAGDFTGSMVGGLFVGLAAIAPTGNPVNGADIYYESGTLKAKRPDGTVKDLFDSSGASENTVNVTSTTPGDIAITSATRVVNLNASGSMTVRGFTAPTTPAAGVIVVTNNGASSATIQLNNGATAANGVKAAGMGDPTFYTGIELEQFASVVLAYDYNAARWIPALGATLSGS